MATTSERIYWEDSAAPSIQRLFPSIQIFLLHMASAPSFEHSNLPNNFFASFCDSLRPARLFFRPKCNVTVSNWSDEREGQNEQVPAYSMRIRTAFVVCIRQGKITGAASRGKQPDRSSEDELDPCRCFWNKISGSAFSTQSTPIALLAEISISVLPNNQNTARPKPQQQQVFPTSKEKISATDAISTRLVASKLITSQPRNTSAAIHSNYSFSFLEDLPRRFRST